MLVASGVGIGDGALPTVEDILADALGRLEFNRRADVVTAAAGALAVLAVVQVGLVWRKGSQLSAAAREFIDVAQAHKMISND